MAPSGNPVPPELRERILNLRAEGLSDEAIGELVGRTGGSVRHIIAKARRAGDPRAAYLTEDARRLRIIASRNPAPGAASHQLPRPGGVGVQGDDALCSSSGALLVSSLNCAGSEQSDPAAFWAEICAHYERGASASSLAARYGRSTTTIRRYLSRAGLIECTDDVKPAQKLDPATRRCLGGCGRMFESKWIGNRICPRCRDNEGAGAWR